MMDESDTVAAMLQLCGEIKERVDLATELDVHRESVRQGVPIQADELRKIIGLAVLKVSEFRDYDDAHQLMREVLDLFRYALLRQTYVAKRRLHKVASELAMRTSE